MSHASASPLVSKVCGAEWRLPSGPVYLARYLPEGSALVRAIQSRTATFLGMNLACNPNSAGRGIVEVRGQVHPDRAGVPDSDRRQGLRGGRVGQVQDLMGAVVLLASDASALMIGTSLTVDGGWTTD